jgi:outer membrane protein assembly factor BamB
MLRFLAFAALGSLAAAAENASPVLPDTSAYEGTWLGEVVAPNDQTSIGFAFKRTEHGLLMTFHMPAMFIEHATLGPVQIADGNVRFPPLDTELARNGDALRGTFGLSHLPVTLRRVERFPDAAPRPTFPAAPAPRWTVALGSETWASPVVQDGTIYVGSVDGKFHALDAMNGHERWTWSGPTPLYGTALVTEDACYVVDERTDLVCLERNNGRLRWRTPLHDATLGGALKPNETFTHRTATPIILRGVLYVGSSDGGIYALNPRTGEVHWRHDAKTKIYASAGVVGDNLLFGGFDGGVIVFDPAARREIARTKLPGPVVSTPVAHGDRIVVGCRDYMLYGLNTADLSIAWKYSYWFSWVESTPVLVGDEMYIGGSDFARITAMNPITSKPRWSAVVYGISWGTPVVTDDTVYAAMQAQSDAIIPHQAGIVAIDRVSGRTKWRMPIALPANAPRAGCIGSLVATAESIIAVQFDGTVVALPR